MGSNLATSRTLVMTPTAGANWAYEMGVYLYLCWIGCWYWLWWWYWGWTPLTLFRWWGLLMLTLLIALEGIGKLLVPCLVYIWFWGYPLEPTFKTEGFGFLGSICKLDCLWVPKLFFNIPLLGWKFWADCVLWIWLIFWYDTDPSCWLNYVLGIWGSW